MSSIEWADPPLTHHATRTIFTSELLESLRANPGRWALVVKAHPSASTATEFKKRSPGFEATVRAVGRSESGRRLFDIYARFVGDGGAK